MLPVARRVPWHFGARLVLFWAVFGGLLMAAGPVAAAFRGRWATDAAYGALVTAGMLALLLWFRRRGWTQLSDCGVGLDRRTPVRFALGVLLGFLLLLVPVAVLAGIDDVRWARVPDVRPAAIVAPFASYVLLSCLEETGFRSYPLLGLQNALGLWAAQAIVATAFP